MRSGEPVALTVAGSDSGGEAGIQADLKTFAALNIHGVSAITCVTAQNRKAVTRIEPCSPRIVRAQMEAVAGDFKIAAVKTGMLYSAAIVHEVAAFFRRSPRIPLVVDPVMISTSGRRLLQIEAVKIVKRELLPLATVVTPNVAEAEELTGKKIATVDDLRVAARNIHRLFGCAALVKGGHLPSGNCAVDAFCGTEGEWLLSAPRLKVKSLHGAGCVYSAAIAAWLARGMSLRASVELAKKHIIRKISMQL